MKKMFILMVTAALLLCGCGGPEPFGPVEERPAVELPQPQVNPDGEVECAGIPDMPQEEESVVEEMETEPAVLTVTVEDQYCEVFRNLNYDDTYCFHIPRFVWGGDSDLEINEGINADHWRIMYENTMNAQCMVSAAYSMGQAKGYASLVTVFAHQDYDYNQYSVFHLNAVTGMEATDEEILAAYGYTMDSFRNVVRLTLENQFLSCGWDSWATPEDYQQMYEEQISDETVNAARPYIDEQGKLCIVATTYGFAGPGHWLSRLCLENPDLSPAPEWIRCAFHE